MHVFFLYNFLSFLQHLSGRAVGAEQERPPLGLQEGAGLLPGPRQQEGKAGPREDIAGTPGPGQCLPHTLLLLHVGTPSKIFFVSRYTSLYVAKRN